MVIDLLYYNKYGFFLDDNYWAISKIMGFILISIIVMVCLFLILGIRIVRPTHRVLIETLGKYSRTAEQGFNWIIPIIQSSRYVNITEQMVDIPSQVVQTADKLNTEVDAVVYYQIKDVKASEYNVDNHKVQLTSLARTTLRAVMGKLTLTQCIQERDKINLNVETILDKETKSYGVEVLRVEVQRIDPPKDVQQAMNEVVKAEQEKIAAKDFATAVETKADGQKRAAIKEAEGLSEGRKKIADANAYKIQIENESAQKYFTGNAKELKQLEVAQESLKENSKIILGSDSQNILKLFDINK
jgi:regulator of protease activity HflC (stomatin/prohibitin superfamily)|tara:strand:- start:412 stop:1314 length:903 start_codon:yes stop_codon:yes gene_type:complete